VTTYPQDASVFDKDPTHELSNLSAASA